MAISYGVLFSWEEMWKVSLGGTEHLAWLPGSLLQSRAGKGRVCVERRCATSPLALWHWDKPGRSWAPSVPQSETCPVRVPFSSVQQNQFDSGTEQSDWYYEHEVFSLLCHTWSEDHNWKMMGRSEWQCIQWLISLLLWLAFSLTYISITLSFSSAS